MLRRVLGLSAVVLSLSISLPAQAFIIDSFDDVQSVSAHSGDPADGSYVAGSMLGGERFIVANYLNGPNSVDADVNAGSSGLLNISLGADTSGVVALAYRGVGNVGLGGVDFTDGGALNTLAMQIPFDDLPVDIWVRAISPSGESSLTLNPGGGIFSPTSLNFPFADFVVGSGTGADFTDIEELYLYITPLFPATDLQIDFLETTSISTVPEPSTCVLAALGLLSLGLFGWRKRRA